mmetsp:Transcript_23270/g.40583  ORF Transcript_23270/g.40583 Transcript_23270/m.40583 type:complete len:80 (+) Transcript_23270:86-325(+)
MERQIPRLLKDDYLDSIFKEKGFLLLNNDLPSLYRLKHAVWKRNSLLFMNAKRNCKENTLITSGTNRYQYAASQVHKPP